MVKITAPVAITGLHVGVKFVAGVGETDNEWLINWFEDHGYQVEEVKKVAAKKAKAKE